MTVTTEPRNAFRDAMETFAKGRGAEAPDWVRALRDRGRAEFDSLGLPTLRDEDWRFTNLAPVTKGGFALGPGDESAVASARIAPFHFDDLPGPRLVFVDGRFSPGLSRLDGVPQGAVVGSLAQAMLKRRHLVEPHLDRLAAARPEPFTSLNGAFLDDGLFVHVPRGTAFDGAVHAVFVATPGAPRMSHPRNLVVVEREAELSVIEDYVSLDETAGLTNAVSEVVIGDGATCAHYVLERENETAVAINTVHAEQGRDSTFQSHSALVGGGLVRNNVYPVLREEGGWSLLNGFYVPRGRQHHDTFMVIRHAAPHCDSRQFYRGILEDRAHAVFSGRIVVHEGAQKTDAKQTNMNLLLSDDALVDTKPQLEIYADDVKCTHGATVGQVDQDAIFYLRARGIPEATARGLLIFAFVNEVLDRMNLEPVRRCLREILEKRLRGGLRSENGSS